jgi:undecaprenyl-diphosphatase
MLTGLYTLILWCSGHAVNVHISILQMFIIFTIGMFSGTIVPLPGGLVGMEAGLLVGLLAYNVSAAQAGAVVVIFRLVTYWLPILPGIAALFLARRRRLI